MPPFSIRFNSSLNPRAFVREEKILYENLPTRSTTTILLCYGDKKHEKAEGYFADLSIMAPGSHVFRT